MTTEFNLSEKIKESNCNHYKELMNTEIILREDVKEFIRLLKDTGHYKSCDGCMNIMEKIDKLAGDRLIENSEVKK